MLKKSLDFNITSIKSVGNDECWIEGYANTKGKDRVGDVVIPSAFEKTLNVYMKNPILLRDHNWSDVVGRVHEANVTENGLYVKARISDTRNDIKTLIREKCLSTMSIGYNEIDADFDPHSKTKYIKALELLEISVVSVPANHEAMFVVAETKDATTDLVNNIKELKDAVAASLKKIDVETEHAIMSHVLNNKKEDRMTGEQLVKMLVQKQAGMNPNQIADQGSSLNDSDLLKEVLGKLDAIAQGLVMVAERMDEMEQADSAHEAMEDSSEEEGQQPAAEPKPEAEAPAPQAQDQQASTESPVEPKPMPEKPEAEAPAEQKPADAQEAEGEQKPEANQQAAESDSEDEEDKENMDKPKDQKATESQNASEEMSLQDIEKALADINSRLASLEDDGDL